MINILKKIYNISSVFFTKLIKFILFIPRLLLGLIIIFIVGILLKSSLIDDSKKVYEGTALYIPMEGFIVEEIKSERDIRNLLFSENNIPQIDLHQLLDSIDRAKNDDKITGLVIELSDFLGAYPSELLKISQKIKEFKNSGKLVTAYSDVFSQSSYIVASAASEIITYPSGGVLLEGFSSKRIYYKDLFDRVGLEIINLSEGQFKTAFENLTLSSMSDEEKDQRFNLLGNIWSEIVSGIENNRNLQSGSINNYLNNIDIILENNFGDWGEASIKSNLVDFLMSREALREYLNNIYKKDEDKIWKSIDYRYYNQKKSKSNQENVIAIITLSGPILDGYQSAGIAGGENISELLNEAIKDEEVKAIVMRVNSPGGSVFASELIRDTILKVKEKNIPIVTSMGGVAASGGYWVAASTDYIFAENLTITGSIGVASVLFNAEETLNKIGLNEDGISSSVFTDAFNGILFDEPNKRTINLYRMTVKNVYDKFVKLVSEGRNVSIEKVNEIAMGRVWTGKQALDLDLVDEIGSLNDAIKKAADLSNSENYNTKRFNQRINPLLDFIPFLNNKLGILNFSVFNKEDLGLGYSFSSLFKDIRNYNDPKSLYYLCGTCIILN